MIELISLDGACLQLLPAALINEVIRSLPDNAAPRALLLEWKQAPDRVELSLAILQELENQLLEHAHANVSSLGEVGRLPPESTGHIVPDDMIEGLPRMSGLIVLALALRTLRQIRGAGDRFEVGPGTAVAPR